MPDQNRQDVKASPKPSTNFGHKDAAAFFRWIPASYRSMGTPFYAELAARCAEDAELMALADETNPNQPYTFMFFGAVRSILLANLDDPLAARFGLGASVPIADDATFAALKDFCRRRRAEIVPILKTRTVQYTLPQRASFIVPLFGHIISEGVKEPFSLIDVGCSAGLLTVFDQYYYDYGPLGRVGDPANPSIRVAAFCGATPPIPDHMPAISERIGVDLNPIDLTDRAERYWIEGLMPPDMSEDLVELRGALDTRARIPLKTIKDDALEIVPQLLPKLKETPVILHSACLYQWPPEQQNKFHDMLLQASHDRTIYRLGADYIEDNPVRPPHLAGRGPIPGILEMFCVTYQKGEASWEFLGTFDGTRREVNWQAPKS